MASKLKALEVHNEVCDLWDDMNEDDLTQGDVNRVEELLDLSAQAIDREDWTGAWLWAGTARAYIRERVLPLPVTA